MEELFEKLGLDEDAPVAKAVDKVESLQEALASKDNIINGLKNKVNNLEDQIDSIATGVAEARVKDLVQKVQNETGYHVGGDHMETLNRKAARYMYAEEDEKKNIWNDMVAHATAYGSKVGMSKKIDAIAGDRDEGDPEDRRYNKAKRLVDSGEAKDWDEAFDMVNNGELENSQKED